MTEKINFKCGSVTLAGHLFSPGSVSPAKSPIVMILTGDGPSGTKSKTWPPMIQGFVDRGLSVFTFDFQGQGYSDGDRSRLCLSVGCDNFRAAYHALSMRWDVQSAPLGLLGSSFGAAVLIASHSSIPHYRAIAMKSPASFLAESYETEHGFEGMEFWRTSDISVVTGLGYHAYLDAIKSNLYASAVEIEVPVLIVHGTEDRIVPISQSRRLSHLLRGRARLVELPQVGHDYEQRDAQTVLQSTVVEFFESTLADPQRKGS